METLQNADYPAVAKEFIEHDAAVIQVREDLNFKRMVLGMALKKLRPIIADKNPRAYHVLRLRIIEKKTLQQIGDEMRVGRERVRQLEARGYEIIKRLTQHEQKQGQKNTPGVPPTVS